MNEYDPKKYWEERLRNKPGLEGVGYHGLGKNFNKWMYRLRGAIFKKVVNSLNVMANKSMVLDIGTGTGFYIGVWLAIGVRRIQGMDISPTAIGSLQQKYPNIGFIQSDISSTQNIDKQYDIISCMDMLFHVVEDDTFQKAISNISSLVKPGGYFILSDNFLSKSAVKEQHFYSRTFQEYRNTLDSFGFKIVSKRPMFYLMNFPIDSNNRLLHYLWSFLLKVLPGREYLGFVLGAWLYLIDLVIIPFMSKGPSTEIMVCQRV